MVLSSIRSHGGHVVSVFSTITVMMMSTMLGLMVCNSWLRSRQGIINAPDSSYDYIIVGGGTAGCVLANRLSDNPNTSVLLVEAGRHFGWLSTVPITAPLLQGSVADWSYLTVPQKHSSWGLWNQSSAWPRGKGLGGSGQLNYLIHFGGSRADFDGWVRSGAEGWGYRDMLPYLGKMFGAPPCGHRTHCTLDYKEMLLGNLLSSQCRLEQQHCNQSESGPMHIDTVDLEQSALGRAFVEAGRLLGLRFRLTQSTVFRGQRWGTLEGYLRPVLGKRKNLHVLLATHANKVVFSQEPGKRVRAVGVELRGPEGESWLVHSSRDTILSAGTVNTPQILMLSGVGPASLLRRLGVNHTELHTLEELSQVLS